MQKGHGKWWKEKMNENEKNKNGKKAMDGG